LCDDWTLLPFPIFQVNQQLHKKGGKIVSGRFRRKMGDGSWASSCNAALTGPYKQVAASIGPVVVSLKILQLFGALCHALLLR
jgi:hypothetical protein